MGLEDKHYDIIIANINRNILLADIPQYVKSLNNGGMLFLSGFYEDDIDIIKKTCTKLSLSLNDKIERNKWVALKFIFE